MDFRTAKELTQKHAQEHLLRFWEKLSENEQKRLIQQIADIDWEHLEKHSASELKSTDTIEPLQALSLQEIKEKRKHYQRIGIDAIKKDKLCLLLLAGGQGTRLGYDKPKGTFNIGIRKELFIFQLLIEHTLKAVHLANRWIPMYIMTSEINYAETVSFFKEHHYFGYRPDFIYFFVQESNPATDFDGKILMSSKSSLVLSPNGNGGWFSSMNKAGLLPQILNSSIEWLNVFAVDNVLQQIADPVFLGATIDSKKMCGIKAVRKNAPEEKVGVLCKKNGHPYIVEYYEIPEKMQYQTNTDGSLTYSYGVTLNYLFPIHRLFETLKIKMPLHHAKKTVPYIDETGNLISPKEPNAFKYETLALDLIHEMDDCLVFEVDREKEFAPVKNKEGIDSIETARKLLLLNGYDL